MKKVAYAVAIIFVILFALSIFSGTAKVDMSFISDIFDFEEPEEITTDYFVEGKYELVNFVLDTSDPDTEELGFHEESVVFALYEEKQDGSVTGYNCRKITWEQLGDVKIYHFGSYSIDPFTMVDVNLYVDFGGSRQIVSEGFYKWFEKHFKSVKEIPEMTLTLEGTFKFKDVVSFTYGDDMTQELSFSLADDQLGYKRIIVDRAISSEGFCDVYFANDSETLKVFSFSEGWMNSSVQTVTVPAQTVTLKFYRWFDSMTDPYVEGEEPEPDSSTYKITAGCYRGNTYISYPSTGNIEQTLNAMWNGEGPLAVRVTCYEGDPSVTIIMVNDTYAYNGTGTGWEAGWNSDIVFADDCTVTEAFYNWFNSNFKKVS